MTIIDPDTGLPTLPEGHFWNVRENYICIQQTLPDTEWKITDNGMSDYWNETGTRETRKVTKQVEHGRRGATKTVSEQQFRHVNRYVVVKSAQYGEWDHDGWKTHVTKPDPVTKENIVERCTKVLNDWNEETERNKLYGHYPPKRLEH